MIVYCRLLVIELLIFNIGAGVAFAQEPEVRPPQMHTFQEVLASHGVTDLSAGSLIATLSDSDPQVRVIAAIKLGEDHHDGAVPAIESALSREQNLHAQIGLSEALWELHDDKGIAHLHAMCTDSSLSFMTLVSVVDALQLTRSPAGICADTFFAALGRTKEPGEIAMGTTRLSVIYCDATPERARGILMTLQRYLANRELEASIRLQASRALANIGTPECAEAIRAAISQEQNPDYRVFFEATLKALEKNPHYCDNTKP